MKRIYLLFPLILILITGCASTRLGFPVETMEIPLQVSLFTDFSLKGTIDNQLGIGSSEAWGFIYEEKLKGKLNEINKTELKYSIVNPLLLEMAKETDLFTLNPDFISTQSIEYDKTETDDPAYCGYKFNEIGDQIPSAYVLLYSIDEWGYQVNQNKNQDGPYIVAALRLVDKETNKTVWEHTQRYMTPIISSLKLTDRDVVDPKDLKKAYTYLLQKSVKYFFNQLKA